jgi:hypothetical protein
MAGTPKLGTGKSAEFPQGGGGGASLLDVFYRDFFTQAGMLPANILFEEIYTFPAEDFTVNLGPGAAPTLTQSMSRQKVQSNGNTDFRYGWDTGADRDKILWILGGLRLRGFSVGIFVSPVADQGAGAFDLCNEPFAGVGIQLRTTAGNDASGQDYLEDSLTRNREASFALYYDRTVPIVKAFVRFGAEQWWPIGTISADLGVMRYVGIRVVPAAGTDVYHAVCPMVIRYE